jgi:hypothetical protein
MINPHQGAEGFDAWSFRQGHFENLLRRRV